MQDGKLNDKRLGWVGAGRMGLALATRLLEAGCDVAVYNRTRSKAEPLAELGATIVEQPADLGDRDIVFTIVAGPTDFQQVVTGPEGLLSGSGRAPAVVVDSTTVSAEASAVGPGRGREARDRAAGRAGQRQPEGGQGRAADDGHLGTRGGASRGAALPRDHGRAAASRTAATATAPAWSRCATT